MLSNTSLLYLPSQVIPDFAVVKRCGGSCDMHSHRCVATSTRMRRLEVMVVLSQFPAHRTITECGYVEVREVYHQSKYKVDHLILIVPISAQFWQNWHVASKMVVLSNQSTNYSPRPKCRRSSLSQCRFQVEEDVGCLCDCPVQAEDCHEEQFYEMGSCRCLCRDQVLSSR